MTTAKRTATAEAAIRAELMRSTKKVIVDAYLKDIDEWKARVKELEEHVKSWRARATQFEASLERRHRAEEELHKTIRALQAELGRRPGEIKTFEIAPPTKSTASEITSVFLVPGGAGLPHRVDVGGYRFSPLDFTKYVEGDQVQATVVHADGTVTCRVTPWHPRKGREVERWETLKAQQPPTSERNPDLRQAAAAREIDALKREVTAVRGELENLRARFGEARERHQGDLRRVRDREQQALRDLTAAVQVISALHRRYGDEDE